MVEENISSVHGDVVIRDELDVGSETGLALRVGGDELDGGITVINERATSSGDVDGTERRDDLVVEGGELSAVGSFKDKERARVEAGDSTLLGRNDNVSVGIVRGNLDSVSVLVGSEGDHLDLTSLDSRLLDGERREAGDGVDVSGRGASIDVEVDVVSDKSDGTVVGEEVDVTERDELNSSIVGVTASTFEGDGTSGGSEEGDDVRDHGDTAGNIKGSEVAAGELDGTSALVELVAVGGVLAVGDKGDLASGGVDGDVGGLKVVVVEGTDGDTTGAVGGEGELLGNIKSEEFVVDEDRVLRLDVDVLGRRGQEVVSTKADAKALIG